MLALIFTLGISKTIVGCVLGGTYSHARPILSYLSELKVRGHTVAFATLAQNKDFVKNTNIPFWDLGVGPSTEAIQKQVIEDENQTDLFATFPMQRRGIFDSQYETGMVGFQNIMKTHHIDYLVCDVFADACFDTALINKLDYTISAFFIGLAGFYDMPYNPSPFSDKTELEFGFMDRFLKTWWLLPRLILEMIPLDAELNALRSKFNVTHAMDPADRFKNRLYLMNTLPGFWNGETPPNVLQVGPIFEKSRSTIDDDLKSWLDTQLKDNNKVAYMAFGSVAYLSAPHLLKLFKGLKCANYKVVFASKTFNVNEFDVNDLVNVKHLKWAPQQEILHHPAVSLFVTHGGIESLHESIEAGKPMLVKPFFGDQSINAKKVKGAGIGEFIMDKFKFTSDSVCNKVNLISNDASYNLKIKKLQALLKMRSKHNLAFAVDHIEFVMDHGIDNLTTKSQSMNPMAAANYDVILLGYFLLFFILKFVFKRVKSVFVKVTSSGTKLKRE